MKDVREQILSNYDFDVHYYGRGKERVLEALDEYALLVLEKAWSKRIDFDELFESDVKDFLEEIKTELNND